MLVSHEAKVVFFHNHKTGGISIKQWLLRRCPDATFVGHHHLTVREALQRGRPELWDHFSFGFVRNPWARQLSWWRMIHDNPDLNEHKPFWRYVREHGDTFEKFLINCTAEVPDDGTTKSAVRNQIDYFTNERGYPLVRFIGRFEQLQEDLDRVAHLAHLPPGALEPQNTASVRCDYREHYTPKLRQLVADRFARDIAAFGYTF